MTQAQAAVTADQAVAGLIPGTYALGSAIGGLWYGSRAWTAPLELVAGLAISPTLIAGFALTERQATQARKTEAMTWLSSAISVGVAIGSAASGHLVDAAGPRPGYALAAGCGALALTSCVPGHGRLRATGDAGAAQWGDGDGTS
jgi:predicted MFS family arabinose efflux permease